MEIDSEGNRMLSGKGFAGMAHDGGRVRDASKTASWVGRIEADGPIAGVLPLPYQAH